MKKNGKELYIPKRLSRAINFALGGGYRRATLHKNGTVLLVALRSIP